MKTHITNFISRFALPVIAGIGLLACQSTPYPITSPYYHVPAGSQVVVKSTLSIPAGLARVYIQAGEVVDKKHVRRYYPHCWFLSRKVSDEKQLIQPGVFTVTRHRLLEEIVMREVQYASLLASDTEPHITAIEKISELDLQSSEQPDLMRLACNHWTDPLDSYHLTVSEMRATLGELVNLNIRD